MTYKAKLPDETVNVSEANMGIYGLKVIAGFIACVFAVYILLAAFSDQLVRFIPVEVENRFYANFDGLHVIKHGEDKRYQDYAQRLLDKIPETARPEGYDITISVSDNSEVNAFALPGGHIILTRGLIDEIESDNGLVFVIGHEIGHFYGRDHLKGISRRILTQVLTAVILGQSTSDISGLTTIADLSVDGHYSRGDETDADIWGVKILAATYGHAGGATQFFETILEDDKYQKFRGEIFSTHPLSQKRIDAITAYIAAENIRVKPPIAKKL